MNSSNANVSLFLKTQGWPPLKESQKFPGGENTISYKRRLLWNKDNPGKRKLNSVSTVKREPVLANTIFVLDSFLVMPRGRRDIAPLKIHITSRKKKKEKKEEDMPLIRVRWNANYLKNSRAFRRGRRKRSLCQ